MIPWLEADDPFPPVVTALEEPNGLLAAGADLTPARLIDAYRHGIFPWYSRGEPILWWSPDPRMVLVPRAIRISRSLAKTLKNRGFDVRFDTAFRQVMRACAAPRDGQSGTWITREMIDAYCRLHQMGIAHSVETWLDDKLVGGLYGIAIGAMFYGESMFARERDASKVALVHLTRHLDQQDYRLIDCQMATAHLASMGAREIPRAEFLRHLEELVNYRVSPAAWRFEKGAAAP